MSNNLNWPIDIFSSPKMKSSEAFIKEEHRSTIQDSAYSHSDRFFFHKSPNPVRQSLPITPVQMLQSPWSKAHHQQQNPFDDFNLACMYSNNQVMMPQTASMGKRINFDQDDDQIYYDVQMDLRMDDIKEQYHHYDFSGKRKPRDQEFMLSTAKKTLDQSLKGSKMSRPRQKGLRKLSSRAYQIVLEMKAATYKQVAAKLVEQLYQQSQLDSDGKDQQNIKRRVYDALNVLIALGTLRKQGRKIVGQRKSKKSSMTSAQEYELYYQRCLLLDKNIKTKKDKLIQVNGKYNKIKNLIERNKIQKCTDKIIRFPIVGTLTNFKQDQFENHSKFDNSKLIIKLGKKPKPFGDVDSLNFLPPNFGNIKKENQIQKKLEQK